MSVMVYSIRVVFLVRPGHKLGLGVFELFCLQFADRVVQFKYFLS